MGSTWTFNRHCLFSCGDRETAQDYINGYQRIATEDGGTQQFHIEEVHYFRPAGHGKKKKYCNLITEVRYEVIRTILPGDPAYHVYK